MTSPSEPIVLDPKYAYRVHDAQDRPTAIVVHLPDEADAHLLRLISRSAAEHGVKLVPVHPDDLQAA